MQAEILSGDDRMTETQLLSIEEAARRLGGISKWTIHAWLSKGRLQRTKVGGRTMIRETELKKVIEDGGKSPSQRGKKG
jgi:excisionase family DNA binding protein